MKKYIFQWILFMAALLQMSAVAFAGALHAEVAEERYDFDEVSIAYPVVRLEDPLATAKVNNALKREANFFMHDVRSRMQEDKGIHGEIRYVITCNKADTFSCILKERVLGANKEIIAQQDRGFIFKLQSGNQVNYNDVWDLAVESGKTELYDRNGLTQQLFSQMDRAGVAVYSDAMPYPPRDLYMDAKLRFHVLCQPGTVTDASAGVVDIDIDEENW